MPIWRKCFFCDAYHVNPLSSLILHPPVSKYRLCISPCCPSFCGYAWGWGWHQLSAEQFHRLSAKRLHTAVWYNIKLKGIQYKTEDSSHSVGLLLDIFPFENSFRLSASAYYFKLKAALSTSIDAVNPIYEELINQTTGTATWERLAPYIGIGWESTQQAESSFGWHASLGALYMGKARVSFQLPDVVIPKRYVGRIQAEEDNIRSKVHDYTWYPVLSLGFTYRF